MTRDFKNLYQIHFLTRYNKIYENTYKIANKKPKDSLVWLLQYIKQHCLENFSVYGMELYLRRSLSPFILSIYLPSSMVSISYIYFIYISGQFHCKYQLRCVFSERICVSEITLYGKFHCDLIGHLVSLYLPFKGHSVRKFYDSMMF